MKYNVTCIDKQSGQEGVYEFDASSPEDARRLANEAGYIAGDVSAAMPDSIPFTASEQGEDVEDAILELRNDLSELSQEIADAMREMTDAQKQAVNHMAVISRQISAFQDKNANVRINYSRLGWAIFNNVAGALFLWVVILIALFIALGIVSGIFGAIDSYQSQYPETYR